MNYKIKKGTIQNQSISYLNQTVPVKFYGIDNLIYYVQIINKSSHFRKIVYPHVAQGSFLHISNSLLSLPRRLSMYHRVYED
jgi:hypothetical protein